MWNRLDNKRSVVSFLRVVLDSVVRGVTVVLTELGGRSFHLILVPSSPRNSSHLSIVHLFVVFNHIFINFSSLCINTLILLVEFVAVLISLVVELVNCVLMVPVLVSLEVTSLFIPVLLSLSTIFKPVRGSLIFAIKLGNVWDSVGWVLLHECIREVLKISFLLPNFWIERINLAVDSFHPVVVHVFPLVIVRVV